MHLCVCVCISGVLQLSVECKTIQRTAHVTVRSVNTNPTLCTCTMRISKTENHSRHKGLNSYTGDQGSGGSSPRSITNEQQPHHFGELPIHQLN
uniref:Secreted protein n=1 Tax=Anguilla anguilla TaxID=7936 RepID=A0A0E9WU71_ANGAN